MNYREFFKGKRMTVMGLGLLGRGVGDAEIIASCDATVTVTDKKDADVLAESVERLKGKDVVFHLGGHDLKDFTNTDMVIKAAGVPLDSSEITAARDAGVPVSMSTALAAKFAFEMGATIVGVTGTRGKTTVAHMIYHVLKRAAPRRSSGRERRAFLGGNIRGISTLALLPDVQKGDVLVLELDSWQLQGFGDLKMSPHVAVFTNFMPDHLNYYAGDMEAYFADKANVFKHQNAGDFLFVGSGVAERVEAARPPLKAVVPPAVPSDWKLAIPGEHNRENASLGAAALRALGLTEDEIKTGLESFVGVEGRLQFVREVNGVKIYNDNNATTPEATIAALRALGGIKKDIVLIVGGDDKGLDMSALVQEIPHWCSGVVLFKERGTDRIRDDVFATSQQGVQVFEEDGLAATIKRAVALARQGEILLYSPAFSSFGAYFKNEFDRNDQFLKIVQSL